MQRRVRFADDVRNRNVARDTPQQEPAAARHQLPSILDALLAEYALQQQQQEQQREQQQETHESEPSVGPLTSPPLQRVSQPVLPAADISIHLSQDSGSPTDAQRPSTHTTPPSPVLTDTDAEDSVTVTPHAPVSSLTHGYPPSVVPLPQKHAVPPPRPTVAPSSPDVLLVTSPSTSVSGHRTYDAALMHVSLGAENQRSSGPRALGIVAGGGGGGGAAFEETWRAQAADNVQRLVRSSEHQVRELLALKPALQASEQVRRDLEKQLRAAQEETTQARLELLNEQNATHAAVETLSRQNLQMQSVIQQLERERAEREEMVRQVDAAHTRQQASLQEALHAAQRQSAQDRLALDSAQREDKTMRQLTREKDEWEKRCGETAAELAHARSDNARLAAKLFESQRKAMTRVGSSSERVPAQSGTHDGNGDDDDDDGAAWDVSHLAFLRGEVTRLQACVRAAQHDAHGAHEHTDKIQREMAATDAARDTLSQRLVALDARCQDERQRRENAEHCLTVAMEESAAQYAESMASTLAAHRAEWRRFAEDLAATLSVTMHTLGDDVNPFDDAHDGEGDDGMRRRLLQAVATVVETLHSRLQSQAEALAEAQRAYMLTVQRAEEAEQAHEQAAQRAARKAQEATQQAVAAQDARTAQSHALDVLSAKFDTLIANALREYRADDSDAKKRRSTNSSNSKRVRKGVRDTQSTPAAAASLTSTSPLGSSPVQTDVVDTPPSTVGGPATTDDDDDASTALLNREVPAALSPAAQWQQHYAQLLHLLAAFRRTSTARRERLDDAKAEAASLKLQLEAAQSRLTAAEQRLHDAAERSKEAHERRSVQLAASTEAAEAREKALRDDVEAAQAQSETARKSCETLRRRVQALEARATEAEQAAEAATGASQRKESEAQNLTELLEAAKRELIAQKAALTEQSAKQTALRAQVARHSHDANLVYQLLTGWVRFCVLLLLRVDRLAALQDVWRQLFWVSNSGVETAYTGGVAPAPVSTPAAEAEAEAKAMLLEILSTVHLEREDNDEASVGRQTRTEESAPADASAAARDAAPLSLLCLSDGHVSQHTQMTPAGMPYASVTSTQHSGSSSRHPRLRGVVLAAMAIWRLRWLARWHVALRSVEEREEQDNNRAMSTATHLATQADSLTILESLGRGGGVHTPASRGPRVVFYEEDAQVNQRRSSAFSTAPPPPLSTSADSGAASESSHALFTCLSPRLVRQCVLGLQDAMMPVVELPPLSELLTALERFHVEAAAVVPTPVLVQYLLHRVQLRMDKPANRYIGWVYGLQPGGAAHRLELPRSLPTRQPHVPVVTAAAVAAAGAAAAAAAAPQTSLCAMTARVRTLLRTAAATQQTLLARVKARDADVSLLARQNEQLDQALASRENAYDGIEASVEELERLLRQRPAPEEMRELREQLVAAQTAVRDARRDHRTAQDRLAEQVEKEMQLLQTVQQLRNQNRLLHIQAARRGVSEMDLDRLQIELFRQPPPPPEQLPSEVSLSRLRPWLESLNVSRGAAPSTVPGCSEGEEDEEEHDENTNALGNEAMSARSHPSHTYTSAERQRSVLPLRTRLVVNDQLNEPARWQQKRDDVGSVGGGRAAGLTRMNWSSTPSHTSSLALHEPVTVDVGHAGSHNTSATTAPSTAHTQWMAETHQDAASPVPRPQSNAASRVAPVIDLQSALRR